MEATLEAVTRSTFGKNETRRLRRDGRLPAVVYGTAGKKVGKKKDAGGTPVSVDPKPLMRIMHSESGTNTLIGLTIDGGKPTQVLVKEFQLDPIMDRLLHVDFYRVAMDRVIIVSVPVTLKGEAIGVKQEGGLLDFVHREVEVECLPADIPEHLEVDVSELSIGDGVRLRALSEGVKWTPISSLDTLLVHVVAPKAEVEETEEAVEGEVAVEGEAGEPEVIKKGKTEDEAGGGGGGDASS
ncbi:MAG: 50S ribosomal protein L25 [Vicinamibacterales bacterium]|jgi:large subunit ribosomal protein L25|nr:50S ribosomal protein L25 [Acidobacteriota bacterium]MDP6607872.1 50S ribosomal protein L25 [Vicinamibacterales bacterium]HAK56783.1 50S ribosomal protein L25 [Acidobacteriota bacterium]|tara:strand:+ start:1441 stop:2160 length:720 start_codon:yes stop_codon:yes gene_type:complete